MAAPRRGMAASGGLAVALLVSAAMGCAQVRQVRPLEPGQTSVSLGFGGPLVQVPRGPYVPATMLNAGANHGLSRHFDLEAGLQLTHLLYGVAAVDYGFNWRPLLADGWRPGLAISLGLNVLTRLASSALDDLRVYPDLGLTLSWETLDNWYTYTGLETWLELSQVRSDGNPQRHTVLPALYLGQTFGGERWQVQIEGRLYAPNATDQGRTPTTVRIGDRGAVGAFVGASYAFGGG